MNLEQQLEVNIEAAELLGKTELDVYEGRVFSLRETGVRGTPYEETMPCQYREFFNIFTNAQDLLDVVKKMGEERNMSFYYVCNKGWGVVDYMDSPIISLVGTYEEAVAEAVIEVGDDRPRD